MENKIKFIDYKEFYPDELEIASLIQRRRLQILIHSYIYYILDTNIISDFKFDDWSRELISLQEKYPKIAKKICFHDSFVNWTGSTGFDLPLNNEWVANKAKYILEIHHGYDNHLKDEKEK